MWNSSRPVTCAQYTLLPVVAAGTVRRRQDRSLPERQPDRPGSAYGYVDMGGWVGGQAEHARAVRRLEPVEVPDKDQAMEKILDLTMLSDIFPTGSTVVSRLASDLARRYISPVPDRSG